MTRVRTDNVFGTITDNPLTAGATTMNSAGLANLAAVSSAEAFIILDPNRVAGAPEIVVVTAHTASATSATIQRGQFGTTARQHNLNTAWVHGPIAANATTYVTAADDQGDYMPMNASETWSPTLTNLTQGNGTVTAVFTRQGRWIDFSFIFTLGSTSTVGTNPQFTLPVAAATRYTLSNPINGQVGIQDTGTANWFGQVFLSGTTCRPFYINGSSNIATISATAPHTWATTDVFAVEGRYEAAT